jgi:hypothetical protein
MLRPMIFPRDSGCNNVCAQQTISVADIFPCPRSREWSSRALTRSSLEKRRIRRLLRLKAGPLLFSRTPNDQSHYSVTIHFRWWFSIVTDRNANTSQVMMENRQSGPLSAE